MLRVELTELRKRFGSVQALDGAGLEIAAGEVHALLGENGAGKTTLVRALYGVVRPDSGSIRIDGELVQLRGPRHALELGVGLVHQHFMLVPELSVAENLALGERGGLLLGPRALRSHAAGILERYDLGFRPDLRVGELSVAQKQRLEIARALSRGVEIAPGREVHHRIGAPALGPFKFFDFFLGPARNRGGAHVGVDLGQAGAADAHGF